MHKGRLEAFSDGVIAIIITIMVLELRPPHGVGLAALAPLAPKLASYALSYLFLGIYWSNHHHLLQAVRHVDGRILWANLHLLFWLSLIPFTTAWVGEAHLDSTAVAAYGVVLLLAGGAYFILSRLLVARHGSDSPLARAVGDDTKGRISLVMYVAAITLAFPLAWGALAIYVAVAIMWLVPDRRIERVLAE